MTTGGGVGNGTPTAVVPVDSSAGVTATTVTGISQSSFVPASAPKTALLQTIDASLATAREEASGSKLTVGMGCTPRREGKKQTSKHTYHQSRTTTPLVSIGVPRTTLARGSSGGNVAAPPVVAPATPSFSRVHGGRPGTASISATRLAGSVAIAGREARHIAG